MKLVICCEFAALVHPEPARRPQAAPGPEGATSDSRSGSDSSGEDAAEQPGAAARPAQPSASAAAAEPPAAWPAADVLLDEGAPAYTRDAPWNPTYGDRYIRKELRSLVKQIEMSVGANRRAGLPFDLHVTSWLRDSDIDVFSEFIKGDAWPVTRHSRPLHEVFEREQVVMLSPDAKEPLTQLEPGKVYCIGGIVDRTVCKGMTAGWASRNNVEARRLPVQEFAREIGMGEGTTKSPVLNISDVVIALVEFHKTADWVPALQAAIPERKKRPTTPKKKKARVRNNGGGQDGEGGPAGPVGSVPAGVAVPDGSGGGGEGPVA